MKEAHGGAGKESRRRAVAAAMDGKATARVGVPRRQWRGRMPEGRCAFGGLAGVGAPERLDPTRRAAAMRRSPPRLTANVVSRARRGHQIPERGPVLQARSGQAEERGEGRHGKWRWTCRVRGVEQLPTGVL